MTEQMNGSENVSLDAHDDEKVARYEDDAKEIMVRHLKRDIKAMMEEGAYRRFVHQDSNLVTAVCGRLKRGLVRNTFGSNLFLSPF